VIRLRDEAERTKARNEIGNTFPDLRCAKPTPAPASSG
jgi:hypothetical protein